MNYYYFVEIQYIWKQKKALKGNPSSKYHMSILDKKEAKDLAKSLGTKINLKSNKMAKDKKSKKDKDGKKGKGKKDKAEPKAKPANNGGGEQRKFSGSIALSKLQHVRTKRKGKNGKVDCLIIPIAANFLVEGKDGAVYMPVSIITKTEEDQYGQHGFIGQNADTKAYNAAKDKVKEKMKKLPILGNIKDFGAGGSQANDNNSAGEVDDDDDLPF